MLRTPRDIIDALGGTAAVADLFGVGLPAVSNWAARDSIPPRYATAISAALKKKRMVADPAVFNMREVAR